MKAEPRYRQLLSKKKADGKKTTMARKLIEKAKGQKHEQDRRRYAKKRGQEAAEPCKESPWNDREVRVLKENCYEGLRGTVRSVRKYNTEPTEPEKYSLQVMSDLGEGKGKMMLVDSDEVVLEDPLWAEPKPMHLDYRTAQIKAGRSELAEIVYWH